MIIASYGYLCRIYDMFIERDVDHNVILIYSNRVWEFYAYHVTCTGFPWIYNDITEYIWYCQVLFDHGSVII